MHGGVDNVVSDGSRDLVDFDATNKVCLDGFPGGFSQLCGFQGTGTFAAAKIRHLICDGTVR